MATRRFLVAGRRSFTPVGRCAFNPIVKCPFSSEGRPIRRYSGNCGITIKFADETDAASPPRMVYSPELVSKIILAELKYGYKQRVESEKEREKECEWGDKKYFYGLFTGAGSVVIGFTYALCGIAYTNS